ERILNALQNAQKQHEPVDAHAQKTHRLAQAVLERDQQLKWHLLENPNRLRIQTMDSFCSHVVRHMPLLSEMGGISNITQDADELYQRAVEALFTEIDTHSEIEKDIEQVLAHLDNNVGYLHDLLVQMLAKRDQWLPHIIDSPSRESLEQGLRNINEEALDNLENTQPKSLLAELITILHCSDLPLNENQLFSRSKSLEAIQLKKAEWLKITRCLLTKEGRWRKIINKKEYGFSSITDAKERKSLETELKTLLSDFQGEETFLQALLSLKNAPPFQYEATQWNTLRALLNLLRRLAAELRLIFLSEQTSDFTEVTLAALTALSMPTFFTLALDYQLRHILVDEFQDTSTVHFELIKRLVAEWTPEDGRSLFVVGDPMQSIYLFRKAEVGLFLRTQQAGIQNIQLNPLQLTTNFRSQAPIVQWINETFPHVFPTEENIAEGAVTYMPCTSVKKNVPSSTTLHPLINADSLLEAQKVIEIIQTIRKERPQDSIAILARARTHLVEIIHALKTNELAYQAIELDALEKDPVIQDLLALMKALLHRGDRVAWLSILRAPWCGLTLKDLHTLSRSSASTTLWEALNHTNVLKRLSEDGQKRAIKIVRVLQNAFRNKQPSLREWVYQTWQALNGPLCIHQSSQLEDAQTFLALIESLETAGDIADFELLEQKLEKLFAAPKKNETDQCIQVMTIHKSKGLEFDAVILPGLEKGTGYHKSEALLWLEQPDLHQDSRLVLAPIKAASDHESDIYAYVKQENAKKEVYEKARLFYVASTRARHQLHLMGQVKYDEEKENLSTPPKGSFLFDIWPLVQEQFEAARHKMPVTHQRYDEVMLVKAQGLRRLKEAYFEEPLLTSPSVPSAMKTPSKEILTTENTFHTAVGTVLHQILATLDLEVTASKAVHWKMCLHALGVQDEQLEEAIVLIEKALSNMRQDPKGQWIVSNHRDAHSEYALSTTQKGQVKRYIIDRTFIDENETRWIIDFKCKNWGVVSAPPSVIPAKAGIQPFVIPAKAGIQPFVIPVKAGIQPFVIPAKAGI
ncbi:MAG: UvrD-helicase domain-containing protein, partial [Gammaproteobacteria bacterium]|nr:UvrD-helicase domain-containing protein [Gammaproteobacteria bacterium]